MEHIARLVSERVGLTFPANRRSVAESAVLRVAHRAGCDDESSFVAIITRSAAVFDELVAELTIGETYFFREPNAFEFVRDLVRNRPGPDGIRAWSAACASGEEAYSLAIALLDAGARDPLVLGTDVSRPRLAAARRGRYRRWSLRGVSRETEAKYFRQDGADLCLDADIRRRVEFRYLNLAEDVYPAISTGVWGMDVIFCRNVLIYFSEDVVAAVARRLIDSLSADGWLILAASDPAVHRYVPCEALTTPFGIAYRRPGAHAGLFPGRTFTTPVEQGIVEPPRPLPFISEVPVLTAPEFVADEPLHVAPLPAPAAPAPVRPATFREAYASRDYQRASTAARVHLTERPDDADAWVFLIRSSANLGDLVDAGAACASALEHHPWNVELLYLHSVLLLQAGLAREAADAARKALYLDRQYVVAHLALANASQRAGQISTAERSLRAAEELLTNREPGDIVPGSDGEPAARLLEMVRTHRSLLRRGAA